MLDEMFDFKFIPNEVKDYLKTIYVFMLIMLITFLVLPISYINERNAFYTCSQVLATNTIILPFIMYLFGHKIKNLLSIACANLAIIMFVITGHVGFNLNTALGMILAIFLFGMSNIICLDIHDNHQKNKGKILLWAFGLLWCEILAFYGSFYMISKFFY